MDLLSSLIKLFILLTPFFALSVFVIVTDNMNNKKKKVTAIRSTLAIFVICLLIYFVGDRIFAVLGITLPAFKIASGLVLFLSGIDMVRGTSSGVRSTNSTETEDEDYDPSVVPMALPYVIGPGTTGALLMMGANAKGNARMIIFDIVAISSAIILIGLMLYFSNTMEKILKRRGLNVLNKLTGLFLASLAVEIMLGVIKQIWS